MDLKTKSEFARMLGVTPQMVDKFQDRLTMISGSGKKPKIDLHGSDTIIFLKDREARGLGGLIIQAPPPKKPRAKKTPPPKPPEPKKPEPPKPTPPKYEIVTPADDSKIGYEKIKIQRQIEQLEIVNQQKRGMLIDKTLVKRVFDRLYMIDQNQFKSLGINISPKISAIYNEANNTHSKKICAELELDESKTVSKIVHTLNLNEEDRINEMNQIIEDETSKILKNIQVEIRKFIKSTEKEYISDEN